MRILNESETLNSNNIAIIEQKMNAKYVLESCIKSKNDCWTEFPVAVFWTEKAHPQGSNYFGVYFTESMFNTKTRTPMICNAITAVEDPITAIQIGDDVVYSRYRHDYREHGGVFVDGGRDYLRCGGLKWQEAKVVKIKVVGHNLEIVEENDEV